MDENLSFNFVSFSCSGCFARIVCDNTINGGGRIRCRLSSSSSSNKIDDFILLFISFKGVTFVNDE